MSCHVGIYQCTLAHCVERSWSEQHGVDREQPTWREGDHVVAFTAARIGGFRACGAQVTSFNDPVGYALPPAMLELTALNELSLRALSLDLIQARPHPV